MKKHLLSLLLTVAAFTAAHAQISAFFNVQKANFMALGGYAYTETEFPAGYQSDIYVRSGPSPENTFSFSATAANGIYNAGGALSTNAYYTPIRLTFPGNNVRKFGAEVFESAQNGNPTAGTVQVTATTNLGYTGTLNCDLNNRFAGFQVTGENEYITSVVFTPPVTGTIWASVDNLILGDDKPQNTALNLDGVDDHVVIPNTVGNFTTAQDFSVSLWVKPNATQTNATENDIISKWDGNGTYPFVIRYFNENHPDSKGQVFVGQWDGANFSYGFSGVSINDGQWHHVALTKSGITFKLYIDGILRSTFTDVSPNATDNTTPLFLGRRGDGNNHFKGEIDEVRLRNVALTQAQIQNDMYCKTPSPANLLAAYNFNEGVPNGNNVLLTQVNNVTGSSHGTLTNIAKTGTVSNFVTGKVRYVKADAVGANNGSSWANAYTSLQSALAVPAGSYCNDIEVWVAKGTYKPHAINVYTAFEIPSDYILFGGFTGTEASINQRNLALINSTNETTLSGDFIGNDIPFDFTVNREDNSIFPVTIAGTTVVFDGFTVRGAVSFGAGIGIASLSATIKNSRVIDNENTGLYIDGDNSIITDCSILGNGLYGIFSYSSTATIQQSLIANNGGTGVHSNVENGDRQTTITNCTIAANAAYGVIFSVTDGSSTNTLKNTLIYGNASGGISTSGAGTITITYSLVQGVSTGTGNLNGNTVNPQFVSPLANTVRSDAGDYRLKWCSKAIGAGTNVGISPLDLDRNPRNFNGTADMGAYEYLGNTPSQDNNSTITGTIDSPTYTGGAIQTITSTAKILAPAGAIDFKAPNSITLNPGFEARGVSSYFKAAIGANAACSN